jgi:coenzyme Q-binding protein COQ10
MHSFNKKQTLPYKAQDLFKVIMDIESYPEFLPWCLAARIVSEHPDHIIAELVIGFKAFTESYNSKISVKSENENYEIEVEAISGPFKKLYNCWKINQLDDNTSEVEFFIEFSFNSFILDSLVGIFFKEATEKMIDAFNERCKKLLSQSS